jgi:glycosyltransferase involved in cell wall biosynthesis
MAGPGIRAFSFARELAAQFNTTLVARLGDDFAASHGLNAVPSGTPAAHQALRDADVVISQPSREVIANVHAGQRLLFDLFDPVLLELKELYGARPTARQRLHQWMERRRLRYALRRGDGWIVAAPRQIDYYSHLFPDGVSAPRDRFLVVPFGCDRLESTVEKDDPPTVVWNGGVWEWLDPTTAIAAVRKLNAEGVRCRLLFLGARRPSGGAAAAAAIESGLSDDVVSFQEQWVPFEERGGWLGRSKVAIMLHRRTAEAEFSVRTRVFDAIGAGLPVVATRGGYAAELVETHQIGRVVEPSDVAGVAAAIGDLLNDDVLYASSVLHTKSLAEAFRWERVVAPIVDQIREWQGER